MRLCRQGKKGRREEGEKKAPGEARSEWRKADGGVQVGICCTKY